MQTRTYDEVVDSLLKGPRLKSEASIDLENIVHLFLDPANKAVCRFNMLGELEVIDSNKIYNLTKILKYADFDHVELTKDEMENYIPFINAHPDMQAKGMNLNEEESELNDPSVKHIPYPAKVAISIYTSGSNKFKVINDFLRQHGQVERLKRLSSDALTLATKECLLATALATYGLNCQPEEKSKPQDNSSLSPDELKQRYEGWKLEANADPDERTMRLYRKEITVETLNAQRDQSRITGTVIQHSGFTSSTSIQPTLADEMKTSLDLNHEKKITIIKYTVPKTIYGLAKNIEKLSQYKNELESLFPPNTQFVFVETKQQKNLTYFLAYPVRTILDINPDVYYSDDVTLRSTLLDKFERKSISNDELQRLKVILSREKTEAAKSIIKTINKIIIKQSYTVLIQHADYVYSKYLSERYKNAPNEVAMIDNVAIPRPNHGLAHAMRTTIYTLPIIHYYKQFSEDAGFQQFCASLSLEDIQRMQLAMLFLISGRESEVSFKANPTEYTRYKKQSRDNFRNYAKANSTLMRADEIDAFAELIEFIGDPNYVKRDDITEKQRYYYYIMDFAHKLDLMRVYNTGEFTAALSHVFGLEKKESINSTTKEQKDALNELYKYVHASIIATGDTLLTGFNAKSKRLVPYHASYNKQRFIDSSKSPDKCCEKCLDVLYDHIPSAFTILAAETSEQKNPAWLLVNAAQLGQLKRVEQFLKDGYDANASSEDITPLRAAIISDNSEVIKLLIKNGANIAETDNENNTLFVIAAKTGKLAAMQTLHMATTDPELQATNIKCGLAIAMRHGQFDAIAKILEMDVNIDLLSKSESGSTFLNELYEYATKHKNNAILFSLREYIIRNDLLTTIIGSSPSGNEHNLNHFLLYVAAYAGDILTTRSLLEQGVDPLKIADENTNPVLTAIRRENCELLSTYLDLDLGPDINRIFTERKSSLLHYAASMGHYAIVKYLLANTTSQVNMLDGLGRSPLHLAMISANADMAALLLENRADPNLTDYNKRTPLYYALSSQTTEDTRLAMVRGLTKHKDFELFNKNCNFNGREEPEVLAVIEKHIINRDSIGDALAEGDRLTKIIKATTGMSNNQLFDDLFLYALKDNNQAAIDILLKEYYAGYAKGIDSIDSNILLNLSPTSLYSYTDEERKSVIRKLQFIFHLFDYKPEAIKKLSTLLPEGDIKSILASAPKFSVNANYSAVSPFLYDIFSASLSDKIVDAIPDSQFFYALSALSDENFEKKIYSHRARMNKIIYETRLYGVNNTYLLSKAKIDIIIDKSQPISSDENKSLFTENQLTDFLRTLTPRQLHSVFSDFDRTLAIFRAFGPRSYNLALIMERSNPDSFSSIINTPAKFTTLLNCIGPEAKIQLFNKLGSVNIASLVSKDTKENQQVKDRIALFQSSYQVHDDMQFSSFRLLLGMKLFPNLESLVLAVKELDEPAAADFLKKIDIALYKHFFPSNMKIEKTIEIMQINCQDQPNKYLLLLHSLAQFYLGERESGPKYKTQFGFFTFGDSLETKKMAATTLITKMHELQPVDMELPGLKAIGGGDLRKIALAYNQLVTTHKFNNEMSSVFTASSSR